MTPISSMERRYCKRCNATKDTDLFYEDRQYCMRCLDKEKEKYYRNREKKLAYFKTYSQIDVKCEVCDCTIRKCRWSRHQKTQKHIDTLEKQEEEKVEQ